MTRSALSRESIVDTSVRLIESRGVEGFTLRGLGSELGTDPTAVYRHFRDKAELLRAVSERLLRSVTADLPDAGWRDTVTEVCTRLRAALLGQPQLASAVRSAPPLQPTEFAITEVLLGQFRRAGLDAERAALAYHGVIELAVGSATIDAALHALGDAERARQYVAWRATYAALDAASYPQIAAAAGALYRGSADDRFRHALDALLTGLTGT